MSEFKSGSLKLVNTEVCPSCGNLTMVQKEEKSSIKKPGLPYVIFGWLFVAVSFLFIPLLFGGAALCMGMMTYYDRSKTHGVILMFSAAMGLIIGSLFSIMVAGTVLI